MDSFKWFAVILVLTSACFAKDDELTDEKRTEIKKYLKIMEGMDIDHILNNTRLMASHIKCFEDEGPCTAQTKDMKKMVPMLIKDSCDSCTKEQKKIMKKVMDKIKTIRPNDYEKLTKLFDPEGKYQAAFMKNLENLD